jgi:hypothetical protein
MAYNARNIIVGAAALYLSEVEGGSTPLPASPAAGTSFAAALEASPATWRHAGYTSEGLELAYEPDYTDIEVDQLLDSAKIFKTSMRASINTTLTEASLDNLLVAWGQTSTTLTSTTSDSTIGLAAGALGDEPVERSLAAVGPAPRLVAGQRRERLYYARRVLSVDSVSVAIRRDEATTFPVSFRLLPDSNFPGSEYGTIRDRNV